MVCETTLRVRNLPKELSETEIQDLLYHFGAASVKVITSKAKLRSVAFAKFDNKEIAKSVMLRLHQFTILNCRLCVEYAEHDIGHNKLEVPPLGSVDTNSKHFKIFIDKLNAFNSAVSFYQPPPPHLKYKYPKPNRATINNIAHALSSVPKFYIQVLHLMNKMNLPPPFSNVPDPPNTLLRHTVAQQSNQINKKIPTENRSSSESELSSDSEDKIKEIIPAKRNLPQKKSVKRPKFIKPTTQKITGTSKPCEKPEDVFEKVDMHVQSKIELKITTDSLNSVNDIEQNNGKTSNSEETVAVAASNQTVITEEELTKNRISLKDLSIFPVFKDYHPGAPTSKLYIKNIAKTVEESDLEYIYKRYTEEVLECAENHFDIRLMKEGRMKGQAFVTLNSVELAQKAVKETNGYVLKDKPLVVVFAKSPAVKSKN